MPKIKQRKDEPTVSFFPYRPALQGQFRTRFYEAACTLVQLFGDQARSEELVSDELAWVEENVSLNPPQRRIYQAAWLLLRDLLRAGWLCRWADGRLEVKPPIAHVDAKEQPLAAKQRVREAMQSERLSRIILAREFIDYAERPRAVGLARLPITSLVADGATLAARLGKIASLQGEERIAHLRQAIRPYLQLVSEGERCVYTGHLLTDIWRYFRYTWATSYYSIPGRTLSYLIRDAAQDNHPVVGIASLSNAPLRIGVRDERFGWTVEAFAAGLVSVWDEQGLGGVWAAFSQLREYVVGGIAGIDSEGLCTIEELAHPTQALTHRLTAEANRSIKERETALRDWENYLDRDKSDGVEYDGEVLEQSKYGNISQKAQEALFRKKRASELSRLLRARLYLDDLLRSNTHLAEHWREFATSSDYQRLFKQERPPFSSTLQEEAHTAINTALIALKNLHIGSSIMELNVCGAVPPYNELLGGKLTALLMMSPQVVDDYHTRYGNAVSQIASQLKGEDVVRPAKLVYIGTTSLYSVGSSQYSRLSLPAGLFGEGSSEARYNFLGETIGYGTIHISERTTKALEDAASEGYTHVNHVFGEGGSPKLRVIRSALDNIFESFSGGGTATDEMSRHRMSRLVYGVELATNTVAYLRNEASQPSYYFGDQPEPRQATALIADYWLTRWLNQRINQPAVMRRLANFNVEQVKVSRWLKGKPDQHNPINDEGKPMTNDQDERSIMRELVRSLYRGSAAAADATDGEQLRQLHVKTDLDAAIVRHVQVGRSVILTGNPGDGKTHLLRVLAADLEAAGAVVELDASARTNEEIYAAWQEADSLGLPYCLAINQAVLFKLRQLYPNHQPITEAVTQVSKAIGYLDANELPTGNVVVFDLSRRNVLSAPIVGDVISHLTNNKVIDGCSDSDDNDDLALYRRLLSSERVQSRLQAILDRISRRGYHTTMRELQAFIAYLLFGDRDCAAIKRTSGDGAYTLPRLVYTGTGALFDELRRSFDPLNVAHPIWDDELIRGETKAEDWLTGCGVDMASIEDATSGVEVTQFEVKKRAFYFYHAAGGQLLALAGGDEQTYHDLLEQIGQQETESRALSAVIRKLNRFFTQQVNDEQLTVWQSHRYNQDGRRVLYAASQIDHNDLALALPRLEGPMQQGFTLAVDHFILYLRRNTQVQLRVDYPLYQLLAQAERGVPVLLLQENVGRIWQFFDQLAGEYPLTDEQIKVNIVDPSNGEHLVVRVNTKRPAYINVRRGSQL